MYKKFRNDIKFNWIKKFFKRQCQPKGNRRHNCFQLFLNIPVKNSKTLKNIKNMLWMRSSSSVQHYGIAGASSQRLREEKGFYLYNSTIVTVLCESDNL